jgi:DNA-binding MarR family transcriptional regulator
MPSSDSKDYLAALISYAKHMSTHTTSTDVAANETAVAARLRLVVMRLARRLRQQAGPGVTPSQLAALSSIERLGPLTLGELSSVERVRPPTMTRIVAGLEDVQLVTRQRDPRDRRVARVGLTPQGQRFVERSRTRKDAYLAAHLRSLTPADLTTLDRAASILERVMEDAE